jgi:hypothetical protein
MPQKSVKDVCCSTMLARVPASSPVIVMLLLRKLRDSRRQVWGCEERRT